MIAFPHAKINLGLSVVSKRPDGFHNLETIFYPIPLHDVLEIVPSGEFHFFPGGLNIPGDAADNLVLRAFHLLKSQYPKISSLGIYLYKAIPLGAGLGGGSSDGAFIIQLLNQYFNLHISPVELTGFALQLGSDCPFFMQSEACFALGRGEILEPLKLDLSAYSFLLIHSEIRIPTNWAYSKVKPSAPQYDLKESISKPVETWPHIIKNDFEEAVFETYPLLKKIKDQLYSSGALFASMTGSGSTIYGIFPKKKLPSLIVENASQTMIQ